MSYTHIKLRELMATRLGNVDPSKYLDECFELYSIPSFDVKKTEILFGKEIGSAKQNVQENDVLLSKIVPHIRRSWVVKENNGYRQIASGEWIVFRSNKVFPNYLKHVVTSDDFHAKFMKTVSGVGGSLLRARPAQVAEISIPLPPLAQQQRIAAILDKAAEIKAKREKAIAKLDELAQSTFVEMFGVKTKKTMSSVTVHDICEFKYGKSLPEQNRAGGDVKVYGSNGVVGSHDQSLSNGETIIIGRKGSFGEINFCDTSCYPIDTTFYIDKTATNQNLTWLRFALGRLGLNKMNKSAAVPGLSREDAYRQVILVPTHAEQVVFERKIKCIEKEVRNQTTSLNGLVSLITSLQHQAFTTGFNA